MMVLVSYDVNLENAAGRKRLRRIAKLCEDYGQRVQFSVFECVLDPAQWVELKSGLMKEMDRGKDSLRFYFLGANWRNRVESHGLERGYDPDGPLVV
ncbi:MAG: CRISPR-associated endonuclease Cas2 [Acidobacteriota bacterium]|jgi:CRISPR-associated protein Cas2|nr:CRISPR-associated endonuclease Cas2 [Acidobacteriota bacterium]